MRLKVRLLGGFEVWYGDTPIRGFESQKVRGLLSYLVCHGDQPVSRDLVAGLFWPGRSKDTARRNLRQAIYNLRSTLPSDRSVPPPILSTHQTLQWNPRLDYWLDVDEFESTLRNAGRAANADPHLLAAATQLYRGDFLAHFFLRDSPPFEEWLIREQERLREAAIEALRALVEIHLRQGEYRFGIQYARRLVAIDPRSEAAHRQLMQLYALSGRRSRALAQYEDLESLLRRDMDTRPQEETTRLYVRIKDEKLQPQEPVRDEEPVGPLIPLAGRDLATTTLAERWQQVASGHGRLSLVAAESGGGKTRLILSFLNSAAEERSALVLKGRCHDVAPRVAFSPLPEVLDNAIAEQSQNAPDVLAGLPDDDLMLLLQLAPDLGNLRPDLLGAEPEAPIERRQVATALAALLRALSRAGEDGTRPVVVLLDDLHWADPATLEVLPLLAEEVAKDPIWLLGAYTPAPPGTPGHAATRLAEAATPESVVDHIELDRLDAEAVTEIARALVGEERSDELAAFLMKQSRGLPLAVTEWINLLWDEGILVAESSSRWSLRGALDDQDVPAPQDLAELVYRRLLRLPTSTRRLAVLAAVMGDTFEAEVLGQAAEEHVSVVEVGLEMLLERWLVRQYARYWTTTRRERDLVLWARGARRGTFEFAHAEIRRALYEHLPASRRARLHRDVAESLEEFYSAEPERFCERLAFHYAAGEAWDRAFRFMEMAGRRAHRLNADDTARHYYERAVDVLERLIEGARDEDRAQAWRRKRAQMLNLRTMLEPAETASASG